MWEIHFFLLCHVKYQNLETLVFGDVILMLTLGYFDNWLLRHWDIVILDIEIMILRVWKFVNYKSFVNVSWMYIWYIKILRQCVSDMAFWDWDIVQGFHFGGRGRGHRTEDISPPWTWAPPSSKNAQCAQMYLFQIHYFS